jgi:hypothetical protein
VLTKLFHRPQKVSNLRLPPRARRTVKNTEFAELIENAPPEAKALLMHMTRTQFGSPAPHPLYHKFTPEHVDKFLDYSHQDDVNAYNLAKSNRWFHLAYVAAVVAFLVFLIVYLAPNHKDLLVDILKIIVAFGGGFGAGFGTKTYLERRR